MFAQLKEFFSPTPQEPKTTPKPGEGNQTDKYSYADSRKETEEFCKILKDIEPATSQLLKERSKILSTCALLPDMLRFLALAHADALSTPNSPHKLDKDGALEGLKYDKMPGANQRMQDIINQTYHDHYTTSDGSGVSGLFTKILCWRNENNDALESKRGM